MAQQQVVRSRVNQPERLLIRSDDDTSNANQSGFSQFQVNLQTPILDAKRCQIIRATIPNVALQIPNYMCVFWYYSLPTATTAPTNASLRAVRLFPSNYQAPAGLAFNPTENRYISDPNDFVTLLNVAAAAGGDAVANNPAWVAGDITFAYNATTKQITMTGNTAGRFYTPAGWNDPLVLANQSSQVGSAWVANQVYPPNSYVQSGGNRFWSQNGSAGTAVFNTDAAWVQIYQPITCPRYDNAALSFPQPQLQGYTLNLRVGYAMSGLSVGAQSFAGGNRLYANIVNVAFPNGTAVPVDSYPDLVYTQAVALYASFITSSSLTSNNRHNLLAVLPIQTISLGVNNYIAATSNLLTKLSQTINNVVIEMRDSADQPYVIPDNAQVDIEVSFSYQDKVF
jgi:hypothetical protein